MFHEQRCHQAVSIVFHPTQVERPMLAEMGAFKPGGAHAKELLLPTSPATTTSVLFSRIHLTLGLLGVVTFLLTGQYMDLRYDHLRGMETAPRMLFRSAHIYLLFSSLLNLLLGVYGTKLLAGPRRHLQRAGSFLVAVGPPLFVFAFLKEPWLHGLMRPFSRTGIYSAAIGVLLHVAGAWPRRGPRP